MEFVEMELSIQVKIVMMVTPTTMMAARMIVRRHSVAMGLLVRMKNAMTEIRIIMISARMTAHWQFVETESSDRVKIVTMATPTTMMSARMTVLLHIVEMELLVQVKSVIMEVWTMVMIAPMTVPSPRRGLQQLLRLTRQLPCQPAVNLLSNHPTDRPEYQPLYQRTIRHLSQQPNPLVHQNLA